MRVFMDRRIWLDRLCGCSRAGPPRTTRSSALQRSDASAAALHRRWDRGAPRQPRRPRRPTRCGGGVGRCDPPARSSTTSRSPATSKAPPTRIAAPSRPQLAEALAGFRPPVHHRLRDSRDLARTYGDRAGWTRVQPGCGRLGSRSTDPVGHRGSWTLSLASRGVRSSIVRLPPTNHGDGDNGFIAALVGIAREKGVSGYIGDGVNRWPAVHRLDSARLFRPSRSSMPPRDQRCMRSQDEGVPIRDIAEVIGRHLDLPVGLHLHRKRSRALHLAGRLPRSGQPGVQRADPRAPGLASDPALG